MTIEVDLPNGRTIYTPNKEIAEWTLGHIHYTLNDVEWREVEERPDRVPTITDPSATDSDEKVLYHGGQEMVFESIAILEYYVRSYIESYEQRYGDATHEVESLSSPHVDVNSLVSA